MAQIEIRVTPMPKKATHPRANINCPSFFHYHNDYSSRSKSTSSFNHPSALNPRFQRSLPPRRTIPRPFRGTSSLEHTRRSSAGYRIPSSSRIRGRGPRKKGPLYSFLGPRLSSLSRAHLAEPRRERERSRAMSLDHQRGASMQTSRDSAADRAPKERTTSNGLFPARHVMAADWCARRVHSSQLTQAENAQRCLRNQSTTECLIWNRCASLARCSTVFFLTAPKQLASRVPV